MNILKNLEGCTTYSSFQSCLQSLASKEHEPLIKAPLFYTEAVEADQIKASVQRIMRNAESKGFLRTASDAECVQKIKARANLYPKPLFSLKAVASVSVIALAAFSGFAGNHINTLGNQLAICQRDLNNALNPSVIHPPMQNLSLNQTLILPQNAALEEEVCRVTCQNNKPNNFWLNYISKRDAIYEELLQSKYDQEFKDITDLVSEKANLRKELYKTQLNLESVESELSNYKLNEAEYKKYQNLFYTCENMLKTVRIEQSDATERYRELTSYNSEQKIKLSEAKAELNDCQNKLESSTKRASDNEDWGIIFSTL